MVESYFVTGATGNVGKEVVKHLLKNGHKVIASKLSSKDTVDVEVLLQELEIPYTFVRPSFFMQNLTTTHLSEIRDEKKIVVPAGKGKTNFIDAGDIGEITALMFFDEKHLNKAYTITGERSYSYQEIADYLTSGLNTKIDYINPNPIKFISFNLKRGRKIAMTLVMLALYSVVKSGNGDITTTASEEILGRKPRGLEEFIQDNKSLLLGES